MKNCFLNSVVQEKTEALFSLPEPFHNVKVVPFSLPHCGLDGFLKQVQKPPKHWTNNA